MEDATAQPTFAVDGNRLTLLDTGPRRLDALLALIDPTGGEDNQCAPVIERIKKADAASDGKQSAPAETN